MEALSLGIPMVSTAPSIADTFGDECCGIITENNHVISSKFFLSIIWVKIRAYSLTKLAAVSLENMSA